MALEELKPRVRQYLKRFEKIEPKRWTVEGTTMELMTEVGDLTELILRKEYYKQRKANNLDYQISDELADILFIMLHLADRYKIDLDDSFEQMLKLLDEKLKSRGV